MDSTLTLGNTVPFSGAVHSRQLLHRDTAAAQTHDLQRVEKADAGLPFEPLAHLGLTDRRLKQLPELSLSHADLFQVTTQMHNTLQIPLWSISGGCRNGRYDISCIPKCARGQEHGGMEKWFERARSAMKNKGVTQADLAEHFEMTQPGMQKWLSGEREPSLDDLIRIADKLDVPRGWLLLGDEGSSGLDGLPDYAAAPLNALATGARSGALTEQWFACMAAAASLLDLARNLTPETGTFSSGLAPSSPALSDQAMELAIEYDKVTDPSQRRMAFAQTHHLLRLLQRPTAAEQDTTSEPSSRRN